MKQNSNIFLCLGLLYCLIIVIDGKPNPEPKAKKNAEIFDYGCPCGERDVTEEEVFIGFFYLDNKLRQPQCDLIVQQMRFYFRFEVESPISCLV